MHGALAVPALLRRDAAQEQLDEESRQHDAEPHLFALRPTTERRLPEQIFDGTAPLRLPLLEVHRRHGIGLEYHTKGGVHGREEKNAEKKKRR